MTVSVGVIGVGAIAQEAHLPSYARLRDVKVVGVADIDEKKARFVAKKYHCKSYGDFTKLIDKNDLDAVSICTPPFARFEIIKYAAENGVNILCEKPLAESFSKALEIYKIVEKSGIQFMIGFNLRFNDLYRKAFKIISDGKLGEVIFLRGVYGTKFPHYQWILDEEKAGGGVLIDKGSHVIDVATWFLGMPEEVQAITFNKREMKIDENAFVVLRHDVAFSQLALSFGLNKPMERLEVFGTACNLIIDHELLSLFFLPASENLIIQSFPKVYINALKYYLAMKGITNQSDSYLEEIRYFVECIRRGKDVSPNHVDALINMAVIHACYKSAVMGGSPIPIMLQK